MSETTRNDAFYSGALMVFERKNSRGLWTEVWAVLCHDSLRLFANHDSFLNGQAETTLISLTAGTICQDVQRKGQQFHFKICYGNAIISFKCDSESAKQEWIDNLEKVLSLFCRHSCFHCAEKGDSIESDIVDNSSASSDGSCRSSTSEFGNFGSRNNPKYSTGNEYQVTKSPLKLYDGEQSIFTSFNKTEKTSATLDDEKTAQRASEKSEKLPHIVKNSFGYSVEGESLDSMTASSLKLFDNESKRFSTFSKQSSLKREGVKTGFANPSFIHDDAIACPDMPQRISTVFNTPLDYDIPTPFKSDPSRGSLKVLTGKNNWKRYETFVEKNFLYLSEPDNGTAKPTIIELKSNINFTLLPRRNHDYRFKITSGTSEYCFKTSNAFQRDSWIKTLTDATRSVCQKTCPQCCARVAAIVRNSSDSNLSEVDTSPLAPCDNDDDVFYTGMANHAEGVTFRNSSSEEDCHPGETVASNDQIDGKKDPSFRSGYMKTNAIENQWEQYWAILSRHQLQLHSSKDNLNTRKTIELSQNVQCKTAKRGSYDFRFTLIVNATQSYEFKCASAHDRREWMTSIEQAGGVGQMLKTGSRISEIVTKIRENESRLEEIQEQQRLEKLQETQKQKELIQQQELPPPSQELQEEKEQQQEECSQDIYDDFAEPNISSLVPPRPNQPPPLTPPQKRQQQVEGNTEVVEDAYELLPGENIAEELPPPPHQKKQQELKKHSQQYVDERIEGLYEVVSAENNEKETCDNQEEFCNIVSADDVLSKQQDVSKRDEKCKNAKEKKIVPLLQKKPKKKQDKEQERKHKKQKKEKLHQEKKANSEEGQKQKEAAKRVQQHTGQQSEETVKDRNHAENILYEKYEESLECEAENSSWNFEQHIQVLQDAKTEDKFVDNENDAWSKQQDSSSDAIEETVPENEEIAVLSILLELQDVERFLTQVLGKLDNLPDDVNKERLELSQRLQKILNISKNKIGSRKKAPLPTPTEPVEEKFDEVDEGEYGDVAVPEEDTGEETYDDVQVQLTQAGEETYDDVAQTKSTDEPVEENYDDVVPLKPAGNSNGSAEKSEEKKSESEEFYDDVDTLNTTASRATEPRPSSKVSNNSRTLEVKNVEEPKKVSDFTDKVYEGLLDKYRTKGSLKGFATKWQRRYCVLTPLALYYYKSKDDKRQKGQIILPSSDCTVRKGCPSFPEVKEKKLCFELGNNERCFLFKVNKESEQGIWIKHIQAAFQTDLSDEQSKIMRLNSMSHHDDDDVDGDEDLYEDVETFQKPSSKVSNDPEPLNEEMYELTDQFSQVKETSGSSSEAPALPSRNKAPSEETPVPLEEEQFEEIDEMEDYEISGAKTPKSGAAGNTEEIPPAVSNRHFPHQQESPVLPPRSNSSQEVPDLPPRSKADAQKPPEIPTRTTPPSLKKSAPDLPPRTTPTLVKKSQSVSSEEPEPSPPPTPVEPEVKPDIKPEVAPPPIKTKPKGEQFDYAKVYVAMWNCSADDEDDLAFSRGNYLYIREKIPNSDWWVASLMDIPDIRVGLVPRNYIMPAYEL